MSKQVNERAKCKQIPKYMCKVFILFSVLFIYFIFFFCDTIQEIHMFQQKFFLCVHAWLQNKFLHIFDKISYHAKKKDHGNMVFLITSCKILAINSIHFNSNLLTLVPFIENWPKGEGWLHCTVLQSLESLLKDKSKGVWGWNPFFFFYEPHFFLSYYY